MGTASSIGDTLKFLIYVESRETDAGVEGAWHGPFEIADIIKMIEDEKLLWSDFVLEPKKGATPIRLHDVSALKDIAPKPPSKASVVEALAEIDDQASPARREKNDQPSPTVHTQSKTLPQTRPGVAAGPPMQQVKKAGSLSLVDNGPLHAQIPHAKTHQVMSGPQHIWFLQYEGSEFGPLRMEEVVLVLKSGKLKGKIFAWHKGFNDWAPIDEVAELQEFVKMITLDSTSHLGQRRRAKRFPFMATVRFSSPDVLDLAACSIGVCMDISEGGLKILSESLPGVPGTPLVVRVNPAGQTKLPAFKVDAQVVRISPSPRGFSVKFVDLDPTMKAILKKHILS